MERLYLILDSGGCSVAQGVLESQPNAEILQIRVLNGAEEEVAAHKEIQLIGLADDSPDRRGTILRRRGERFVVQPTAVLGPEARENLRIDTRFRSVLYPVSGAWRGQRSIRCHDLSCGGVAFYCEEPLEVREVAEIVLPVTDEPLILKIQILRPLPTEEPTPLYAAKFVDLIQDQEILIRKAVFSIEVSRK